MEEWKGGRRFEPGPSRGDASVFSVCRVHRDERIPPARSPGEVRPESPMLGRGSLFRGGERRQAVTRGRRCRDSSPRRRDRLP